MAAAQKVNSDPKADQTKVNDANTALEKAIKDLKEQEKPDPEPTPELKAPEDMMKVRNLGRKSLEEVLAKLKELNLELNQGEE